MTKLYDAAVKRVEELEEIAKNPDAHKPIPTGLKDLDNIMSGGLPRYPFYCAIVGEDKKGKSTVGKQIAFAFSLACGKKLKIYDLEETEQETVDRALTMRSVNVTRTDIFKGELTQEQLEQLRFYADSMRDEEIYIEDGLLALEQIIEDAEKNGIEIVCIDNFQLIVDGVGRDQREKLVNISKRILAWRKKGISIFLLSQGNPDGGSFGSKQVQMDANVVILVDERFEGKKRTDPVAGIRILNVTRCRWAAPGLCEVIFEPQFSRVRTAHVKIVDLAKDFISFGEGEEMQDYLQEELGLYNHDISQP